MTSDETTPATPAGVDSRRRNRRTVIIIAVMVAAFAMVVWQRNRIRAEWWARKLAEAQSLDEKAYYMTSLLAVGESAHGAIARLARHESAEVRSLAVVLLARTTIDLQRSELPRLMDDADQEVRELAASTLVLTGDEQCCREVMRALQGRSFSRTRAAAAALSRAPPRDVVGALSDAARQHEDPATRAQAIESLALLLQAEAGGRSPRTASSPVTFAELGIGSLVDGLLDQGLFEGRLAAERAADAATRFVESKRPEFVAVGAETRPAKPRRVCEVAQAWVRELTGGKVVMDDPAADPSALAARILIAMRQTSPATMPAASSQTQEGEPRMNADKRR